MHTTTNSQATIVDQRPVGTVRTPSELAFAAMNTNASFNITVSARAGFAPTPAASYPADDADKGRAVTPRGNANQVKIRASAVGTGTCKARVYGYTPNEAGTYYEIELIAEVTFTFTSGGRVTPAAMVNGAAGTVRYATSMTLVDHTPMNTNEPLKSEPGSDQPAYAILDVLAHSHIEVEGAIDGGGITSFNFHIQKV